MMLKSDAELALIRESCKWGNLAHRLLQKYTRVGANETEVSMRAGNEATLAMIDALGSLYRSQSMWSRGASAGYRGQIGRNAAIPHSLATNAIFMPGDVLVSGAGCPMWGYNSELERTMIIGEASAEQKKFFDHMVALQDTALNAIKPGAKCSDVDRAVRAYFDQHNLMPYWRHHSGHAIGLRYHEGPFLDSGDDTMIEPGMVFTVEPGLYAPQSRRLSPFRYHRGYPRRNRDADVLSARFGESNDPSVATGDTGNTGKMEKNSVSSVISVANLILPKHWEKKMSCTDN